MKPVKNTFRFILVILFPYLLQAQDSWQSQIVYFDDNDKLIYEQDSHNNQIPDFSYAGYGFGEVAIPASKGKVINASEYGVVANDGLDDSKALIKVLEALKVMDGSVVLQLPPGRLILSGKNMIFRLKML